MKKKLFILASLLVLVGICFAANTIVVPIDKTGKRVDPGSVHTARPEWEVIATSASAGAEPTDLTTAERTYQTVAAAIIAAVGGDEKIQVFDIPRSWNAIRLRAIGITADQLYTAQVYVGTLGDGKRAIDGTSADCELAYLGEFVFTAGAQASTTASYEMADTLAVTESDWIISISSSSPTGDRVAEAAVDIMGADLIVIVPTVIGADSKLLARGY